METMGCSKGVRKQRKVRRRKWEGWEVIRATRRPRQCEQKEEMLKEPPGSLLNRGGLDQRLLSLSICSHTHMQTHSDQGF